MVPVESLSLWQQLEGPALDVVHSEVKMEHGLVVAPELEDMAGTEAGIEMVEIVESLNLRDMAVAAGAVHLDIAVPRRSSLVAVAE